MAKLLTMHPKIVQQKELMEMALQKLQEIETIERLIKPVDPITAKIMIADLKLGYGEITRDLFNNFLLVSSIELV